MLKHKEKIAILLILIGLSVVLLRCCVPLYNLPKSDDFEALKYDISKFEQDEESLIFAAFSGGGSRAAYMCWEVLRGFKKIKYIYTNKNGETIESNLAEQIDYISSISGGSFAAAAWCLFKDSMEIFDERFNNKNIQGNLIRRLLLSSSIFKIVSPYYNRINVASEYYDRKVFDQATFSDLPVYPILWINSTHLGTGLQFTYIQDYFDLLNSDIKTYPIGYACAASSAFPILLDPITLINYSKNIPDSILNRDKKYKYAKRNRDNYEKYLYIKQVDFFNNEANKWNHMMDGGLSDNQGLQAILNQFQTNGIINKRINNAGVSPLKKLVFININCGTEVKDRSAERHTPPRLLSVIKYAMTTSMDRLSTKRWEEIKLRSRDKLTVMKKNGYDMDIPYLIEINFRHVKNDSIRSECMDIPTSFKLNDNQRNLIKETIPVLMSENRDLNRLKNSLAK